MILILGFFLKIVYFILFIPVSAIIYPLCRMTITGMLYVTVSQKELEYCFTIRIFHVIKKGIALAVPFFCCSFVSASASMLSCCQIGYRAEVYSSDVFTPPLI
jgi:hypothetical protein